MDSNYTRTVIVRASFRQQHIVYPSINQYFMWCSKYNRVPRFFETRRRSYGKDLSVVTLVGQNSYPYSPARGISAAPRQAAGKSNLCGCPQTALSAIALPQWIRFYVPVIKPGPSELQYRNQNPEYRLEYGSHRARAQHVVCWNNQYCRGIACQLWCNPDDDYEHHCVENKGK